MDASDLTRLFSAKHYAPADLEQVNDLCRNYPMFSLAHMLKVRILEALGKEKDTDLKLAAVYAPDRNVLYRLVTEVTPEPEEEIEFDDGEPEGIRFTDETNEEAEVIIEQHAPYAGPPREEEGTLLELDEDTPEKDEQTDKENGAPAIDEEGPSNEEDRGEMSPGDETPAIDEAESPGEEIPHEEDEAPASGEAGPSDEEGPGEMSSENLIEAVVKDDADLEDPEVEDEAPAIDVVESLDEEDHEEEQKTDLNAAEGPGNQEEPESDAGPEQQDQTRENVDPKLLKKRLIQNFIREDPGPIRADNGTRLKGDVSVTSVREHDGFITDTLAKIYVKQGLNAKAIYAYEKLSLKYPEKSAYFAAQIEKIRNINHS